MLPVSLGVLDSKENVISSETFESVNVSAFLRLSRTHERSPEEVLWLFVAHEI